MLTAEQKDVIRSTVPLLESGGEALITHFYQRLLRQHPDLNSLFNQAHQLSGDQPRALARGVLSYARHIDRLEELSELVQIVVNKHVALQVQADHYPLVGTALLQSIEEVLGPELATPAVIEAWACAYQVLAEVLIQAEAGCYERLAAAPGGWRGARRFVLARREIESQEITSFYFLPVDGRAILQHQPGQYIAVRLTIQGEEVRRTYSLSSAHIDHGYRISVKREPGGLVSNFLHDQLHVGDEVDLFPPSGHFVLQPSTRPAVLISGGVGITPTLAMLEQALQRQQPVYFIHAARNRHVHAFRERVDALARQHPHLHRFYCYSQGGGESAPHLGHGTLDADVLSRWLPDTHDVDAYFLGPAGFMGAMYRMLSARGIPRQQLRYEFFGPAKLVEAA